MTVHNFVARMQKKKTKAKNKQRKKKENLKDNICMLFKLIFVKKKSAADIGDGERCKRSWKYELPIYHKTGR